MRGRRFAFVVGGLLAASSVVFAVWSALALGSCDEHSDVRRSSLAFRMCGMDRELIASIPSRDPHGEDPSCRDGYDQSGRDRAQHRARLIENCAAASA